MALRIRLARRRPHTPAMDHAIRQVWREVASGPELSLEDVEMGLLALLGFAPPADELQRIYTEHLRQGPFDETRFHTVAVQFLQCQDEDEDIRQTFMAFDRRGRGFLVLEDFLQAVAEVGGSALSPAAAEEAFREIDADGDGRVSFRDFQRMMRGECG